MNGYVFTVQATANAFAAAVETALGYPKAGRRVGGGDHGPAYRARALRCGQVKQHVSLSQWMYPSNAEVNGSGVSVPPAGATEQAITPTDWTTPNPANYVPTVMAMGDSIAEGAIGGSVGWRPVLWHLLSVAGVVVTLVGSLTQGPATVDGAAWPRDHEGHQGFVVSDLSAIAAARITTYLPDIVLLMIGANDVSGAVDIPGFSGRLTTLLSAIYGAKPDVIVSLSTLLPFGDGNTSVLTVNTAIRSVVTAQRALGRQVRQIDAYAIFAANASYAAQWLFDNVHPNDTGYTVLADVWAGAILDLERET